ncbi:MAG: hypothetical protein D6737_07230 [Chloroflexi bacterium]|nr:MAG: hypothetical protein CUN54_01760 [Phototrophicales bacterium]RMF80703.1 MAG: hypothetical protein D6737_07230 [Chloroflexota bacterium]
MIPTKPRLVFQAKIERGPYMRQFRRALIPAIVSLIALAALAEASNRELVDGVILGIGAFVAIALGIASTYRALAGLIRGLRARDEELRFYDKGFVWVRDGQEHRYSWADLTAFRETVRSAYIGRWPLFQRGAYILTMRNGQVFRVTGKYGDLRKFIGPVRRFAAEVTGTRIGRRLRNDKPIRIHKNLVVWPGGVEVKNKKKKSVDIPWSHLNIKMRGRNLLIQAWTSGKFKTIATYPIHEVDNLGGFLEVATATMRNHQRQRFEK